jgi:hypothetical protein
LIRMSGLSVCVVASWNPISLSAHSTFLSHHCETLEPLSNPGN